MITQAPRRNKKRIARKKAAGVYVSHVNSGLFRVCNKTTGLFKTIVKKRNDE